MCILQKSLEPMYANIRAPHVSLSPPIATLLQTCIDSATAILKMLRALKEQDLLGMELRCTYH